MGKPSNPNFARRREIVSVNESDKRFPKMISKKNLNTDLNHLNGGEMAAIVLKDDRGNPVVLTMENYYSLLSREFNLDYLKLIKPGLTLTNLLRMVFDAGRENGRECMKEEISKLF